jgi:hypothetical protein
LSQVCVLDRSHGRSGERSNQGQSHCGEFECVHLYVPVKLINFFIPIDAASALRLGWVEYVGIREELGLSQ